MKQYIKSILVATAITATAIPGAEAARGISPLLSTVSEYQYPATAAKGPAASAYLPDGETYLRLSADKKKIIKYETATDKEITTVFDAGHTRETTIESIQGFTLSEDGERLLIYRDAKYIYRRSFTAEYYVFEIKRNILLPLSTEHPRQQSPVFSHDGLMVAFVADNNIYLKKLIFNTEVPVTTDGEYNKIINGISDWCYEEEFATTSSLTWSADNTTLAYIKYNEAEVPLYSLPIYDSFCTPDSRYSLYPGEFTYKYPVAGEKNSIVSLHSYDIDTRKTKNITFEDSRIEYIPRIQFIPGGNNLVVATLNREQNRLELYSVNPKSTVVKSILVEESPTWILPASYENLDLAKGHFVIQSNRSGYTHLYKYSYAGALLKALTAGEFDVTEYYGTDAKGNVYYQSTSAGPLNRVVSRIDWKTGKVTDISPADGTSSARFTPAYNYYILNYSSTTVPPVYKLISATKDKELKTIEDNSALAARFRDLPKKEFTTFESEGFKLNAYIIKPKNFDPTRKYPVIMTQYSGPGSQQVLNKWSVDWHYAAVEAGYIVVCVDARGTGGRGRDFMTCTYKNLGHYETIDQVNAARQVAKLPYVDGNRIGMTGWSYGGYETLMCLSAVNSPFATGVAIAPVTDWRLYDSIYTERYMSTPQINEEGYNESAPLRHTDRMNSELLIIYGTADDNVHPANSVEYVSSLQAQNRLCSMLLFPNMNHSINGCNGRAQVYTAMLEFFNKNL